MRTLQSLRVKPKSEKISSEVLREKTVNPKFYTHKTIPFRNKGEIKTISVERENSDLIFRPR